MAGCGSTPGPEETDDGNGGDAGNDPPGLPPVVGAGCELLPTYEPPTCNAATVLCVDGNVSASSIEEGTAANPFHSIAAALAAAPDSATILVAAGEYNESITVSDNQIQFRGGFVSGGDFTESDPGQNQTTIKGSPGAPVFTLIAARDSVIDGFRITGGTGRVDYRAEGGAIYTQGGNTRISCNLIEGNDVRAGNENDFGGGIALHGDGVIYGNQIRNNFASKGAGIFASGGTIVIERNRIENNTAIGDHGGGMYVCGSDLQIISNIIVGNEIGRELGYGWEEATSSTMEQRRL